MAATLDDVVKAIKALSKGNVGPGANTPAEDPAKLEKRIKAMEREEELLRRKKALLDDTDNSLKAVISREQAELSIKKKMEEQAVIELKLMEQLGQASAEELQNQRELVEALENEVDSREESIEALKKDAAEVEKNTKAREKQGECSCCFQQCRRTGWQR